MRNAYVFTATAVYWAARTFTLSMTFAPLLTVWGH